MKHPDIRLGMTVEDVVTGFTGVATAFLVYIYGCHQVEVAPPVDGKGKKSDSFWFDVSRLRPTEAAVVELPDGSISGIEGIVIIKDEPERKSERQADLPEPARTVHRMRGAGDNPPVRG